MRSKRYPLALMPSWVLAIAMGMASQAASAARCDVDADRDIDRIDIVSIRHAVGSPASGVNDPRDGDGDGRILRNDELLCALRYTLPLCEIGSGDSHGNRRPRARHDSARTAEDTSVRINVIANDRDPDGRLVAKSIKIVTRPKHGRVRNQRNGIVTYTPASGFTGRDQFRYRIRDDDHARSRAARVRLIVERGNHPPLADAGSDTNTTTGLPVTLDGSDSSDPDGDALSFLWRFLSVPPPSAVTDAALANGNTAAPRFTPDVDGPYELALEASDGARLDVDTVIVAARAANVPPNANAGPDANAVAGQTVNLDGRGSTDPDNGPAPLRFRWSFAALPPGSLLSDIDIAGASTALASFTPDFAGDYRISLDVDDGADTGRDEVLIAAALPNVAPNANAGADLVVQLGAGATLDGAASNDPDNGPTPLSFQWTFVNVPVDSVLTDANLSGATTVAPSFTPDVEGFYLLRLDVSDGDLMDMDQVQVKANVAPVAVDDAFTVTEDTVLNEPAPSVLGNDSDGTSDPLTALLNTDVSHGTLTLNSNGSFTYTPATDFEGTDSFTYWANDGTVNSTNLATVTITVSAVDDPPVAVNDVATVNEDAPATTIAVLANDTDVDGGAKTIMAVQNPSANGGTVLITNGGADLTYQPAADYCNAPPGTTDTFTYTLSPGGSTGTVGVTVNCVDDPPVAANDVVTIDEDASATTIAVLANDPDLDGGAKAITAVQNPSANGGTVLIANGGADLTYQPAADYCNAPPGTTPDTFAYTLSPGGLIAAVSVMVNCVNDAPVIANLAGDTLAYTQGDPPTPIDQGGDAAATDVDSPDFDTGTLTVSLPGGLVATEDEIGIRNQGTAVNQIGITGTDVTFNPGSGAAIIGSFSGGGAGGGNLVVTFNASAGATAVSALLRNITYRNSNTTDPTAANRTVRFMLSDGDGGTSLGSDATIAIALNTPPELSAGGASPTFTEDGAPIVLDGTLTVTDANDTNLESATVRITAGFQTGQDLLGFVDAPPITGTFDTVTGILSLTGSATLANYQTALRSVTYQNTSQNPNTAARSVAFVANDGSANSNTITKTVTVQSVNDAPSFAASNPPTILEDAGAQTVVSWATFNPGPPDESGQAVVGYTVSNISNGALFSVAPVVVANGTLTYTPATNVNGVSTFDVVVEDDGGTANGGADTSAPQIFTITVDALNDAPSFTKGPDQTVNEDAGPQTVSPWATAIDDGEPESTQSLTFNVTGNTNPSLFSAGPSVSPTGVLTYTPTADANGPATVTVTLSDDGGIENGGDDTADPQTFTITVNAVNDAPSFTASDPPTMLEDSGAQTVSNWATFNAGPANESSQTVLGYTVSNVSNVALFSTPPAVASNGTLTYAQAANAFGTSTFQVMVQDDGGSDNSGVDTSAPQTFTITVTGVNDAPSFLSGGPVTVLEDAGPQTVSPWATAISPGPNESSQTLSFNITNNTNPSLFSAGPAVSAAGALIFTPAPNAFGSANIMLVLQDNGGGDDTSGPQSFTITMTAVNDAPVATAKSHQTHSGIRVTIGAGDTGKLKDGATDVDDPFGDLAVSASFTSVTPAGATIVLSEATTGTFTYNPPAGFFGPASFQYQVCDDGAPTPPVTCSTPTTVSFNVTGPDLWFVDATAAAGGSGRRTDPFDALSDLPAGRGTGDRIFVFTGTYLTGHTLFTNEHLIGQGSSDTFDSVFGVQAPGNGTLDSRPTLGGTRPQLNGTVAVAGSSVVRGFNIVTSGATGLTGGAITGVTVNEASVSAINATAVNLNSGGAFTLTRVDSINAANGIILNNNPAGSFTVTGTGTSGTGGTIQNTTGDGISLNSASSVSLNFMNIVNNLGNGIRGNNVTGFTLASSTVDNNADDAATDEAGLHFTNLVGTASITSTTVSNHLEDNARILNSSGTLSQLTITNSTFRDTDTVSPGNNGLLIQGDGNANMTVDITNSSFLRNRTNGLQVINNGSGTVDVEIGTAAANSGGTFQNNNVGVNIAHNGSGTLPFDVLNASFSAPTLVGAASPINLNKGTAGTGTMSGMVSGNAITNANSDAGPGIRVNGNGVGGTLTTLIQSNNISQVANRGIEVIARDGSNTLNATISNNVVTLTDPLSADGIRVDAGSISSDTTTICADITGNTSTTIAGVFGIRVRQRFAGTTFRLEDYAGSATDDAAVASFLSANNNGATTSADHGGAGFLTIADCPTP